MAESLSFEKIKTRLIARENNIDNQSRENFKSYIANNKSLKTAEGKTKTIGI